MTAASAPEQADVGHRALAGLRPYTSMGMARLSAGQIPSLVALAGEAGLVRFAALLPRALCAHVMFSFPGYRKNGREKYCPFYCGRVQRGSCGQPARPLFRYTIGTSCTVIRHKGGPMLLYHGSRHGIDGPIAPL